MLQPGAERRRTSSHYTPRSLSEPIVRRALEPLFKVMGGAPASERILSLKVCDPAMGSGAFLVEACRFLGDQLVAAWTREKKVDLAPKGDDIVMRARRLVAQRCLYGVDKNPFAVSLAKLSLWLVTLAKDEPFTFLDHALRCGDSLVGLAAWMDAFVGNPPFIGGRRMRGELGDAYLTWLEDAYDASLNADYSAFFFRRAFLRLRRSEAARGTSSLSRKAGMTLNAGENKIPITNHKGPHTERYHRLVYEALDEATSSCRSIEQCRAALIDALEELARQIATPGTELNQLVTRGVP